MKAEKFVTEIVKTMTNPKADRFCPFCRGRGSFGVVIAGEYSKEWQIIGCHCLTKDGTLNKENIK